MSLRWEICEPDEAQRLIRKLSGRFAGSHETAQLIVEIQGVARSEGYRLANPRFEWVPTGSDRPLDQEARHLVCDGVERVAAET